MSSKPPRNISVEEGYDIEKESSFHNTTKIRLFWLIRTGLTNRVSLRQKRISVCLKFELLFPDKTTLANLLLQYTAFLKLMTDHLVLIVCATSKMIPVYRRESGYCFGEFDSFRPERMHILFRGQISFHETKRSQRHVKMYELWVH